jgi:hypothetical protein
LVSRRPDRPVALAPEAARRHQPGPVRSVADHPRRLRDRPQHLHPLADPQPQKQRVEPRRRLPRAPPSRPPKRRRPKRNLPVPGRRRPRARPPKQRQKAGRRPKEAPRRAGRAAGVASGSARGNSFSRPRAQCLRRGYSQVTALFCRVLLLCCGRFLPNTTTDAVALFLD